MFENNDTINWNTPKSAAVNDSMLLPAGEYLVEISSTEMRQSLKKNCSYLEIKFKVISPENYHNRIFYIKYFIQHDTNEKMVKWHINRLKDLSLSAINKKAETHQALIGAKLYVSVDIEEGRPKDEGGKWPDSHRINGCRPFTSQVTPIESRNPAKEKNPIFDDAIPF